MATDPRTHSPQRARRFAIWRGAFVAILTIVGWLFLNGLAESVTTPLKPPASARK
ncbi:hypothetical protein [Metapseudomonas otitidis]|uniref:hypothetical protein n=1 Tax=Metapseudomonas otitidis TaxID=319939 RepID=UPI001922706C|nr:hypothetical protein [Pseudomonas otitidis]